MNAANPMPRSETVTPLALTDAGGNCCDAHALAYDLMGFHKRRQNFLDALPLPTAIICEDAAGRGVVECGNPAFAKIAGEADSTCPVDERPFFAGHDIRFILNSFADREEPICDFELTRELDTGTQHFLVKLSKLPPLPFQPRRLVLSLIDQTQQIETERDLRTQMLRDNLTGTLKRQPFTDGIAALLAAGGGSSPHAVVVIDVTRFSRINESHRPQRRCSR